jgi:hypothetical protein
MSSTLPWKGVADALFELQLEGVPEQLLDMGWITPSQRR